MIFFMQISCVGNLVTQAGFQIDALRLKMLYSDWLSNKHQVENHTQQYLAIVAPEGSNNRDGREIASITSFTSDAF